VREPEAQKNYQAWPPFEGLMDYKTFRTDSLERIDSGGCANWSATLLAERCKSSVRRQAGNAGDSVITIGD
jgi:hypothetical protein